MPINPMYKDLFHFLDPQFDEDPREATVPGFASVFARILGRSPEPRVSRPDSLGRSGSLP